MFQTPRLRTFLTALAATFCGGSNANSTAAHGAVRADEQTISLSKNRIDFFAGRDQAAGKRAFEQLMTNSKVDDLVIRFKEKSEKARLFQELLNATGVTPTLVTDGAAGRRTFEAWSKFCEAVGLDSLKDVRPVSKEALCRLGSFFALEATQLRYLSEPLPSYGDKSNAVRQLQGKLNLALGEMKVADGDFQDIVKGQILSFQRKFRDRFGLSETNVCDPLTMCAIDTVCAEYREAKYQQFLSHIRSFTPTSLLEKWGPLLATRGCAYTEEQLAQNPQNHVNDPFLSDRLIGECLAALECEEARFYIRASTVDPSCRSPVVGSAPRIVQAIVCELLLVECRKLNLSDAQISHILAICRIESGFTPDARAGTSSAQRLFQFIDETGATAARKAGLAEATTPTNTFSDILVSSSYFWHLFQRPQIASNFDLLYPTHRAGGNDLEIANGLGYNNWVAVANQIITPPTNETNLSATQINQH